MSAAGAVVTPLRRTTGHPAGLPIAVVVAFAVGSGVLLAAWFVLYERDATRARRLRRGERDDP